MYCYYHLDLVQFRVDQARTTKNYVTFALVTGHNFSNSSSISCFEITIQELIAYLESELEVKLNWSDKYRIEPEKVLGHNYR